MILRLFLLLTLFFAPAAFAQPAPISPLLDHEFCLSLGVSEDPTDIDEASCKPFGQVEDVNPQGRIVWVRGRFVISEGYPSPSPLGLYTGALASRDMWWNGERIGAVGKPGASVEKETVGDLDAVTWIPPHLVRTGENTVIIRYSSFHLAIPVSAPLHYIYAARMGGPSRNLLVGYAPSIAATGALVAAAVFFGFTFVTNRRLLGSLFISLMSLFAVGQLWLEAMRGFTSYPYPVQIWRLSGIAFLAFAFALSMTAYVASRFAPHRWRLYVAIAAVAGLALTPILSGFDGKTLGFILGPTLVSLFIAARGVVEKQKGAAITTAALVAFLLLAAIEQQRFLDNTFYLAISLLAIVLFADQVRALRRARDAEEQANRRATLLELELLKRRIAPHFLMNTLNALAEWVETDPKSGVKMIEALAGEFRLLSQISDQPLIPLREEIALCRRHLEVMSWRVDRAFSLETRDVDETMEVPPGVLHTLVENAFTHGRLGGAGEFVLTRETSEDGDRLVLLTPPAADATSEPPVRETRGEGLAYVRRRLEAAFGAGARVDSGAAQGGWRTVLTIPRATAGVAT